MAPGITRLFVKPADGSREERLLLENHAGGVILIPTDVAGDGAFVMFTNTGLTSSFDLWMLALKPETAARVILRTPFNEIQARLSPDGRWLAYVSDDSGTQQVYVQSFAEGLQRWQISSGWRRTPLARGWS